MSTTKKSFTEIAAEVDASKHNSDLLNLAHALKATRAEIRLLEKLARDIGDMAQRIEEGEDVPVADVRVLYDAACSRTKRL